MGNPCAPSIWRSVKIAKNLNCESIPTVVTLSGLPIAKADRAEAFAKFFNEKITSHARMTNVCNRVYNGKNKIIVQNRNFMLKKDIEECIKSLKPKRCEGFDRIPVCVITDACDILIEPFTQLFQKIYSTGLIPDQWRVSKIIPIFKKGDKSKVENYRPIANLCSASKIFEKLILKQIHYLESTNKLDLTGKQQHGFKKNKSTATAAQLLQSIISRAADDNHYVLMASLILLTKSMSLWSYETIDNVDGLFFNVTYVIMN